MKQIPLSGKAGIGKFAIVDDEYFDELSKRKWHSGKCGYPAAASYFLTKERRPIMMHSLIMKLGKGELVDHIDGNPLNNQKNNLRRCTKKQNNMNRIKSYGKLSIYKGVSPSNKRWRSQIMINDKYIHLGCFGNEIEAAKAYDKKAIELFGEFAKLNFPL